MAKYQGHESRAAWNVSLWINNDEGLYDLAKECVSHSSNRLEAAKSLLDTLQGVNNGKTPDGYTYSLNTVRKALVGF